MLDILNKATTEKNREKGISTMVATSVVDPQSALVSIRIRIQLLYLKVQKPF
jgi:hypothetical protein